MSIGDRISNRRKQLHLTLEEVGNAVGVGKSTVRKWETGDIKNMRRDRIALLASVLQMDPAALIGDYDESDEATDTPPPASHPTRINVLGQIRAGIPMDAIEDIEDWEEIPESMARTGTFVGLRVKGDSMLPKIEDGDVAIIRIQDTIENGQIAAVLVNGNEATIKKVKLLPDGIMLIGLNPAVYEPHYYSNAEVASLPVRIFGRLVEVRRKF